MIWKSLPILAVSLGLCAASMGAAQTLQDPPAGADLSVVPQGLVAEDQTPSGRFLTAGEVKPILAATRANWVAVRAYDGQDWLYVTHLWSWRCGLAAIAVSVNDGAFQNWPMPPCRADSTTPTAILDGDGLPATTLPLEAIRSVSVQLVYDDLSVELGRFERAAVLIP